MTYKENRLCSVWWFYLIFVEILFLFRFPLEYHFEIPQIVDQQFITLMDDKEENFTEPQLKRARRTLTSEVDAAVCADAQAFAENDRRSLEKINVYFPPSKVAKGIQRWRLNNRQIVQNRKNRQVTFRQLDGGLRYRGISLSASQFWEMDKIIHQLSDVKGYHTQHLGHGIHFTQLQQNVYTLWKQSRFNPKVKTAFFRFDQDSWQEYIKTIHDELKSLLHSVEQE